MALSKLQKTLVKATIAASAGAAALSAPKPLQAQSVESTAAQKGPTPTPAAVTRPKVYVDAIPIIGAHYTAHDAFTGVVGVMVSASSKTSGNPSFGTVGVVELEASKQRAKVNLGAPYFSDYGIFTPRVSAQRDWSGGPVRYGVELEAMPVFEPVLVDVGVSKVAGQPNSTRINAGVAIKLPWSLAALFGGGC